MSRSAPAGSDGRALQAPLWRAIAVFRVASLGYATAIVAANVRHYRHPAGGWVVVAVMAAWTAVMVAAYASAARRRPPMFVADVAVAAGCLLVTGVVETPQRLAGGAPNLTVSWVAASVMACGVAGGRRWGTVAGAAIGACDVGLHHRLGQYTLNGVILLLVTGFVAGHVGRLTRDAEMRLAHAVELEAATRERERLARRIHDSVLQVLALVRRRGLELDGEAAELGRLAGEQEVALRALIGTGTGAEAGEADLRELLAAHASTGVSLSAPATPVPLPAHAAREVAAAVGAALDNVHRHCGATAKAWVSVEEADGEVIVSVRDDGPGIAPGRLEAAAAAGRLGVAQSILGRVRDLGGAAEISSRPGEGTEIELRIPVM